MGVATGVASSREEQPRASQRKPSPPKAELSLSPRRPPTVVQSAECIMRPGFYIQSCLRMARTLTLNSSHPLLLTHLYKAGCGITLGIPTGTPVLSFLLKLPEGGAAWLRRPRHMLSHKGQAKGCGYPLPSPRLQGSRPVPPTHLIFYSARIPNETKNLPS